MRASNRARAISDGVILGSPINGEALAQGAVLRAEIQKGSNSQNGQAGRLALTCEALPQSAAAFVLQMPLEK